MRTAMQRAICAVLLSAGGAVVARAGQHPGWGDTGWVYASKRDCCNEAIAIAVEQSILACTDTGGVPRFMAGARRGTCKTQWMQGPDGAVLYRCYGEAAVWCR